MLFTGLSLKSLQIKLGTNYPIEENLLMYQQTVYEIILVCVSQLGDLRCSTVLRLRWSTCTVIDNFALTRTKLYAVSVVMSQATNWTNSRTVPLSQVDRDPIQDLKAAEERAHIVFVPGHWHTLYHAKPLVTQLEKAGYGVTPHQLASVGLKDPAPTFADDVNGIVSAVTKVVNAGKDVILVLHSYAGMPGSEAVNKFIELDTPVAHASLSRGVLRRVVYISAYMFPPGFVMDAKMFVADSDPMFSIDEGKGLTYFRDPYTGFFNDMNREDAQPFLDQLADTYYLGTGPCITSENYRSVPMLYIQTEKDQAMPLDRQVGISQGMPNTRLNTGHDPFISQTEAVAAIIGRVASSQ